MKTKSKHLTLEHSDRLRVLLTPVLQPGAPASERGSAVSTASQHLSQFPLLRFRSLLPLVFAVASTLFVIVAPPGGSAAQPDAPVVIHISPAGADANPGTPDKPLRSFDRLRTRLAEMPRVSEVVFHAGTFRGGLMLEPLEDVDPVQTPLTLRAAEGQEVIFDGTGDLGNPTPVVGKPGVFAIKYQHSGGDWPRLWESDSRVRYHLVADLAAVAHFPSSYTVTDNMLYFHTSDGREPKAHQLGISRSDCGLFINRPYVTAQGFAFRNYLARGKWSCGIDLRTHHITVQNCRAWNCSMGFTVTGDDNRVLNCTTEDVGNGVYVGGKNARVEGCRLFKKRDAFMVPMYSQDDTAIQYYFPAGNGEVRNNLCVGFAQGIFMKPSGDAYLVEHNTILCSHWGLSHTWWTDKCHYRYNIVVGSEEPLLNPTQIKPGTVDWNCYWLPDEPANSAPEKLKDRIAGEHSIIADPEFVNPAAGDYRLAVDSPCLKIRDAAGPCGAFPVVSADFKDTVPPEVVLWVQKPAVLLPPDHSNAIPRVITAQRKFPLHIRARDAAGQPTHMSLKLGDNAWEPALPFAPQVDVVVPENKTTLKVAIRVADGAGNWSEARSIQCEYLPQPPAPQFLGQPQVHATVGGLAVTFATAEPTFATLEFGPTEAYGFQIESSTKENDQLVRQFRTNHVLAPRLEDPSSLKRLHWRLRLESRLGAVLVTPDNSVELIAKLRTLYLAPDGLDTNPGTADRPWKTLQHAVDRALAGDTILLKPGIYDQPAVLTHGGIRSAPIIIRAEKKWETILDGNRDASAMIELHNAPFVEIHDLQIRWYGFAGILIEHSPNITVRGCKIWNDFWEGWPTGRAISVSFSPHFTGERNVLFRQEHGFWLYNSPQARILQNTCTANLYGAAQFLYSVRGSVCKNNDFAFQGNDVLGIEVPKGRKADLDEFECDFNNLGTMLREQPPGTVCDSVTPRESVLRGGSKAIIAYNEWPSDGLTRLLSLAEWRAFSGKDQHSIFADPLHRSVVRQQFELDPGSPNLGAGEAGSLIGAFGPVQTR
ncbi:MAG TPA: right-handed parallel beta-helix repeat-containing protein [Clostridia bacterium]|nr:right-handed parallel beta-helix repeat-containing protein [Clostridia bacterium]